jgi:hypothetical protein
MSMRSVSAVVLRILFYNVLILFVIANVAYWAIPIVSLISKSFETPRPSTIDERQLLPNYAGVQWADQHFRELGQLTTGYKSFIGWRRKQFKGQTIVVGGPYFQRRTVNDRSKGDREVYFFGGSTMWGTGAPDSETIPSQFAAITGMRVENFGESAYVAHQGLAMLIQLLEDGHRPNLVIFYDGANEVDIKCRRVLTPTSYVLESRITSALETPKPNPLSFTYFLRPVISLADEIHSAIFPLHAPPDPSTYDCNNDRQKAEAIAENLVRDWTLAKQLVESYGGEFIAALQPVAFFSKTRLDHVELSPELEAQFRVVYPFILMKLARTQQFYDLTAVLDIDEYVYIDFCHVSPNGNRRIAASLAGLAGPH